MHISEPKYETILYILSEWRSTPLISIIMLNDAVKHQSAHRLSKGAPRARITKQLGSFELSISQLFGVNGSAIPDDMQNHFEY
jgi:hypothetical protein